MAINRSVPGKLSPDTVYVDDKGRATKELQTLIDHMLKLLVEIKAAIP